jgi:hypothetical protein
LSVSNAAPSAVSTTETSAPISRTNIVLIVLLLLQVALSAYLLWPSDTATATGAPILKNVTTGDVTGLTITDNNARSVSFVKEGDTWTLADSDGYPANSQKITEMLDKLVGITTDRLVTKTPASHDRLQVAEDNYQRKVDITTADGVQTLYLGSSTGAAATHVRAADDNATYLTSALATYELDTLGTSWIDVTYYQVPKDAISQVTLQNANGTFTFVRKGSDWTLADATPDEPVASANINTLIDRIATLNLHSVLGKSESPDYGLASPLATLTVTTVVTNTAAVTDSTTATTTQAISGTTPTQTKTTTFVVGAKDEANDAYYFKSSDSDYYVRLAAFTGDEFVNKQRSDFMVQASDTTTDTITDTATSDASAAPQSSAATPSPEATSPAVGASSEVTQPVDLGGGETPLATVEAVGVQTDTASLEGSATPTTTVQATSVTTTTNAVAATGTPTATLTPMK